jgi:hypothetical protein
MLIVSIFTEADGIGRKYRMSKVHPAAVVIKLIDHIDCGGVLGQLGH